jgi:hypothetical protein
MRCVGGLPRSFARCALLARVLGGGLRALAALAGVVGAVRRLHCDARPQGAPRNSLRSLRSLRSDNRGESEMEARCARRPESCASRHPGNRHQRPQPAAQHKRAREVQGKEQQQQPKLPAQLQADARSQRLSRRTGVSPLSAPAAAPARSQRGALGVRCWPRWRRAAQVVRPRAQRASLSFSAQLFERSERSERSEFCAGPCERAAQGSRHAVPTATAASAARPEHRFAEQHECCSTEAPSRSAGSK